MGLGEEIILLQKQQEDAIARLNSIESQLKVSETEQRQSLEAQRTAIQAEIKDIQEQIAKKENLKEVGETIVGKNEIVQEVAENVIELQKKILEENGVKQMPDLQQYIEQQIHPNNPAPADINKAMETVAEVGIPQQQFSMEKDAVNTMDPVTNVLIVGAAVAWATNEIVEKVKDEFKDKDIAKQWENEINQKETELKDKADSLKQSLNQNQVMQEVYINDKAKFDIKENPADKEEIQKQSEAKIKELEINIEKEKKQIDADFESQQKPLQEQKEIIEKTNEQFDKKIQAVLEKQLSTDAQYKELQALEKERQAEMERQREEKQRELERQRQAEKER